MLYSRSFLGFVYLNESLDKLVNILVPQWLSQPGFTPVFTLNPEIIVKADAFQAEKKLIASSLCLCDGIGLSKTYKWFQRESIEKVSGIDFVTALVATQKYSVFILGGSRDVLEKTILFLKDTYPGLDIKGYHHGFFKDTAFADIVESLIQKKPDLILVGMGFPLQEKVLIQLKDRLNYGIGVGVGGTFDIWSGSKKRAPLWVQNIGLEWLFRVVQEPARIRRLTFIPLFFLKLIKNR